LASLRLFAFGHPKVELAGIDVDFDTRSATALLVYLSIEGRAFSREELATLFWPDVEPKRSFQNLRRTLWTINKNLGKTWLVLDHDSVQLKQAPDFWMDVLVFQDLVRRSQEHNHPSLLTCALCSQNLRAAVELYRGDFMSGFGLRDSSTFDDWQFFQRERLKTEAGNVLNTLVQSAVAQSEPEKAVDFARQRLTLDPVHEETHRQLMLFYANTGQRSAALRQYEIAVQVLEKELGVSPEQETIELVEQIRSGTYNPGKAAGSLPQSSEAKMTSASGSSNGGEKKGSLPYDLTPFIGRQSELDSLNRLLEDSGQRLFTLTGPGGSGKTRLAIQAAANMETRYKDGVYFVYLAPVTSSEHIIPAAALALKFSFYSDGDNLKQQMIDYLRHKEILLLLDNFEHLVDDESTQLLVDLLSAAPGLKILVTSRVSLSIKGEQVFPVSGLEVPETRVLKDLEASADYSAVQLFVQSAQRVYPEFKLTPGNSSDVVHICQKLQGMPLGIELASAWLDLFSPREVLEEIERSLDFLETELRDIPERQRSLRAVFNTTWRLLSSGEQEAFKKLSVFQGSFTRQAAAQVTEASSRVLAGLVSKSLVHRLSPERFVLHELLRQYAAEVLIEDSQERMVVIERYIDYYGGYLQEAWKVILSPQAKSILGELDAEADNLRAAWNWALEKKRLDQMERMLYTLYLYSEKRGLYAEMEAQMERAASKLDGSAVEEKLLLVKVLAVLSAVKYDFVSAKPTENIQYAWRLIQEMGAEARLGFWFCFFADQYADRVDPLEGIEMLKRSLERLAEEGELHGQAFTNLRLAAHLYDTARKEEAKRYLATASQLLNQTGDRLGRAEYLTLQSSLLSHDKSVDEAIKVLKEATEIYEDFGDLVHSGLALMVLGGLIMSKGKFQEGIEIFRLARSRILELGKVSIAAATYSHESIYLLRMGDVELARQRRLECLEVAVKYDSPTDIVWSQLEMGEIERVAGNLEASEAYYQKGWDLIENHPTSHLLAFYYKGMGDLALARSDYQGAKEHFIESVRFAREIFEFWCEAYSLSGTGSALLGLGDLDQAHFYMKEGIAKAREHSDLSQLCVPLTRIAALREAAGDFERAVEIGACVENSWQSWYEFRVQVGDVISRCAARLPAHELDQARQRGKMKTLENLANEISGSVAGK
jgi:predicted ATPase/DNA-binding SARP family transcriptional activator